MSDETQLPPEALLSDEEITAERVASNLTDEQRAKIKAFVKQQEEAPKEETESGSEAVAGEKGATNKGSDVDWSAYNLQYEIAHHYKAATYRDTPQGPAWVVMLDEFWTLTREYDMVGKVLKDGSRLNLGEFLTETLNNGEGWRVVSILPSGMKAGVTLQKQVAHILPEPELLKTDVEVEAPGDAELERAEDAALNFMENEGLSRQLQAEAEAQEYAANDRLPAAVRDIAAEAVALNPGEPLYRVTGDVNPAAAGARADMLASLLEAQALPQGDAQFLNPKDEESSGE